MKGDGINFTAVDLFAGAGGMTQGLKDAGFRVLAGVESDSECARTYRRNHSEVNLVERDIKEVEPRALLETPESIACVSACPPCQGFSSLGRRNTADERNDLVNEVWRFVSALRPGSFVLENVPGLAQDVRFAKLLKQARAIGYGVQPYVLDAATFGVPQTRVRLVTIAIRGVRNSNLPDALSTILPSHFKTDQVSAGAALEQKSKLGLTNDPSRRGRSLHPASLERVRASRVGSSHHDLPEDLRLACHGRLKTRSATASYGRIDPEKPAPTMTTRCTTPACGRFIHPYEDRGLTLREAATLQTFPSTYFFEGGYDSVERQIGDAFPVRLGQAVGLAVMELLNAS